jgi:hypothetical protein
LFVQLVHWQQQQQHNERNPNRRYFPTLKKKLWIRMLDEAVKMYDNALKIVSETGKRVSKNTFQNIAKVFGNPTWMDQHAIWNHHIIWTKNNNKYNNNNNTPPEEITVDNNNNNNNEGNLSELTNDSNIKNVRYKGGWPTGTISSADVEKYERLIQTATTIAAKKYQELKACNKKITKWYVRYDHKVKSCSSWLTSRAP